MSKEIKISFGIIVFNGQPFTKYCLRSIYPYAHEIIVAEGACLAAKDMATKDGHSTDGTLQALYEFKNNEDPENKLKIITKNGFWTEKDEQSQAYSSIMTGNYLWQIDIDEFYIAEDIEKIIKILQEKPDITAISFKQLTFWGDLNYKCDSVFLKFFTDIHRIFKFEKGYKYLKHRPPIVTDNTGRSVMDIKPISATDMEKKYGVYMYHYSLLLPKQVREKILYYKTLGFKHNNSYTMQDWAYKNYFAIENPFLLHNVYSHPGWIERYEEKHPEQIKIMMQDIKSGKINYELRDNSDVEELINNPLYLQGIEAVKNTLVLARKGQPSIKELFEQLCSRLFNWGKRKLKQFGNNFR